MSPVGMFAERAAGYEWLERSDQATATSVPRPFVKADT